MILVSDGVHKTEMLILSKDLTNRSLGSSSKVRPSVPKDLLTRIKKLPLKCGPTWFIIMTKMGGTTNTAGLVDISQNASQGLFF